MKADPMQKELLERTRAADLRWREARLLEYARARAIADLHVAAELDERNKLAAEAFEAGAKIAWIADALGTKNRETARAAVHDGARFLEEPAEPVDVESESTSEMCEWNGGNIRVTLPAEVVKPFGGGEGEWAEVRCDETGTLSPVSDDDWGKPVIRAIFAPSNADIKQQIIEFHNQQ